MYTIKTLLSLFLIILVKLAVFGQSETIMHWSFDSNTEDQSIHNNHGTLTGGRYDYDRFGNKNSALELYSNNQYIQLQNPIGPTNQWAVSFWAFHISGSQNTGVVLDFTYANNMICMPQTGSLRFRDGVNGQVYDWNGSGNTEHVNVDDHQDTWHHYMLYADGINIYLEVDSEDKGFITPSSTQFEIRYVGSVRNEYWYTFRGVIDDLYIVDHLPSAEELNQLRESGTQTAYQNLFSHQNNIGIGNPQPEYLLDVAGTSRMEEVIVEVANAPDYVFEADYELRTLRETEKFISKNKHLPEIPPAKAMEINGAPLGELNMLLLKKIEELTLYQIELLNRLEQIENSNTELKNLIKNSAEY